MEQTVIYHTFTDEQIKGLVEEAVTTTLQKFGVDFDDAKARFTPDTKDEYKPLSYWLQKMNVNRSTLWRWQKEGRITPRYVGKKLFFRQRDFDEMFAKESV